jgi:aspartate carbamoyltransferase regulatory subunit
MDEKENRIIVGKAVLKLPNRNVANVLKPTREQCLKDKYPEFNIPAPEKDGKIKCPYCGNKITKRNIFIVHLKTNKVCKRLRRLEGIPMFTEEEDFPCEYCKRCFSTKQSWMVHQLTCKGTDVKRVPFMDPTSEASGESSSDEQCEPPQPEDD